MKQLAYVIAAAVLAVALVGCEAEPQLRGEAVIYVAAPLTGDQADGGQSVLGGARLRAEEANRQGGVAGGRRVVVRGLNDEADEEVAAEVAEQIAQSVRSGEEVLGVIGHYNSGATASALQIYRDVGVVVVTPSSSNPDLSLQGYDRFFRVCATDALQGPVAAGFLLDQGLVRIALLRTDNEYARGLGQEFSAALALSGARPAIEIVLAEESATYATDVQRLWSTEFDAIFFAGDYPDGIVLVRELRQAGINTPILASDANFVEEFIDQLGDAAQGVFVSAISPDPRQVASDRWFEEYKSLEARNPGMDSTTGYSAADVLVNGSLQAASLDAGAVAAAIRQLDIQSLVGRVRYDANGDLLDGRIYVFEVKGERFAQVDTPNP